MNVNITQGQTTLDNVVRSYLFDNGYNSLHRYAKSLSYAFEALTEFKWDSNEHIKTTTLTIAPNKTATLPIDYIDYSRIYYKHGDSMQLFINDNYLSLDVLEAEANDSFFKDYIGTFHTKGQCVHAFGFDSGGVDSFDQRYFRIDKESNRIMFSASIDTDVTVYIEYVGSVYSVDTETLVDTDFVKAIKGYIHFKHSQRQNGEASSETQLREKRWRDDLITMSKRSMNIDIRSIVQSSMRRFETYYRRMYF